MRRGNDAKDGAVICGMRTMTPSRPRRLIGRMDDFKVNYIPILEDRPILAFCQVVKLGEMLSILKEKLLYAESLTYILFSGSPSIPILPYLRFYHRKLFW